MTDPLVSKLSAVKISQSNKFGEGIVFREGSPVRLLGYNVSENGEFGKIVLNQDALNILKTINEPLAIISVGKQ